MIVVDFEVYKNDWLVCWLDTTTRKMYHIVNDKTKFEKFYEHYKNEIWVTYNGRQYDVWIAKSILCGFNPYLMNDWIINQERKGYEFSRLLNQFPILNYDCIVGFRSLKELEAFMGSDIRESDVPFDIDRKLTTKELQSVIKYCEHDVMETFKVFIETKDEFESHIGLLKEFNVPITHISKTKAQISAFILGANKITRDDEFDIVFPDTIDLGKYQSVRDYYDNWSKNDKDYAKMELEVELSGVPHKFGVGGIHGAIPKYVGDGDYILADVSSYYPALMIEYDFLSRNVSNPKKFKLIRDERLVMKAKGDPREFPRKILINATFGASKDQYNNLYDPLQANNICIAGQLLLVDLIDKLEGYCEIVQSNTDGILFKLFKTSDYDMVIGICEDWSKRTRMDLAYKRYSKVVQKDVNNYIMYGEKGVVRKGAFVKETNNLDNNLTIVNTAVVNYFLFGTSPEVTIMNSTSLIDFQMITKVGSKYEYAVKDSKILRLKVFRVFASKDENDGTLYKKHKSKTTLDKTAGTPERCFIDNANIVGKGIPSKLDLDWYIDLAKYRIGKFIG